MNGSRSAAAVLDGLDTVCFFSSDLLPIFLKNAQQRMARPRFESKLLRSDDDDDDDEDDDALDDAGYYDADEVAMMRMLDKHCKPSRSQGAPKG